MSRRSENVERQRQLRKDPEYCEKMRLYMIEYNNRPDVVARMKEYREARKEKLKAQHKAYYEKNREFILERKRMNSTKPETIVRHNARAFFKRYGLNISETPKELVEIYIAKHNLAKELRGK